MDLNLVLLQAGQTLIVDEEKIFLNSYPHILHLVTYSLGAPLVSLSPVHSDSSNKGYKLNSLHKDKALS